MSSQELSPEAKAAIQRYMLTFVLPSGAALTVLSGLLGYVVSGLSRIDATTEAAKIAMAAMNSSAEAKANAARAAEETQTIQARAQAAAAKADETSSYLLSVRSNLDNVLTGQYEGLAKSLFEIKAFRDSIQTIPQIQISEFNSRLKAIESSIYDGGGVSVAAPNNSCPPDTFVVSVSSVGVPGGRAGFLESVSVRCQGLRFPRPK